MTDCPTPEELRRLLEGPDGPEPEAFAAHLERCPACQEALERLTGGPRPDPAVPDGLLPTFVGEVAFLLRLEQALHPSTGLPDTSGEGAGQGPPPPEAVGGYEVVGELGRGGMGVVYKAWQARLRRVVALKMLTAGAGASAEGRGRLQTEAEALARLRHPHIVQVHEVGEQDGRLFLVLEYADRGSLAQRLAGAPLPPPAAARLVETLARAVQAAHAVGVVHRDLKPGNILLTSDGGLPSDPAGAADALAGCVPKVADFGLAKMLVGGDGMLTRTGLVMGTPCYMAPEQADGRTNEVGPATDVYALGAILYECLTGRPPFKAADTEATLRQVREAEPVAPRLLNAQVTRDLETVCLKCLEKESHKRYATAGELADDLARFGRGEPVRARRVGRAGRLLRWARRRPALAAVYALLALVAVLGSLGGGALLLWQEAERLRKQEADAKTRIEEALRGEEKANQEAEAAKKKLDRLLDLRNVDLALHEWDSAHFDRGRQLLDRCSPARRGWEWRYVNRLLHRELFTQDCAAGAKVVAVNFDPRRAVALSPDARRLAGDMPSGTVRVWDAETGREIASLSGGTPDPFAFAFSPDGKRLAAAGREGTCVWEIETGTKVASFKARPGEGGGWGLAISPDGRRVARAEPDGTVRVREVQTGGEALVLKQPGEHGTSVAFSPDGKRIAAASHSGSWGKKYSAAVCVWDAETGQEVVRFDQEQPDPNGGGEMVVYGNLAFRPYSQQLACGGNAVRLFDLQTRRQIHSFRPAKAPSDNFFTVAYHPSGQCLAVGGDRDRVVRVLHENGREWFSFKVPTRVVAVAFEPAGQRLASADVNGGVHFWRFSSTREGRKFSHSTTDSAFSPDGKYLASTVRDAVRVCDLLTGAPVRVFRGHEGSVHSVCYSPDGKRLATAGEDTTVRIWDAASGRAVLTCRGHTTPVQRVAFSPDGRRLASAGFDTVRIWDAASGREEHVLKANWFFVCWSPDGRLLATGRPDGTLTLWDAARGAEYLVLKPASFRAVDFGPFGGSILGFHTAAFSPDGSLLAAAGITHDPDQSLKGVVTLFNIPTGEELRTLWAYESDVTGVAFSPDGERLALAGHRGGVQIWDVALGEPVVTLPALSAGAFNRVTYSPDGQWLAGVSMNSELVVWDGRPQEDSAGASPSPSTDTPGAPPDPYAAWLTCHVEEHPDDPQAYSARGARYVWVGEYRKALGDVETWAAQYRKALREFETSLLLAPDQADVCGSLARIYTTGPEPLRDAGKVLPLARRAVKLAPDQASYHNTLGVAYYRNGQPKKAVPELEASLKGGPGTPDASNLFFLALCHQRLGDPAKAKECYDRAVDWCEKHKDAPAQQRKELEECRAEAEAALRPTPR
jgi:WD40 repeat protein/Tfp pilus assembly protein PilF